MKVLQISPVAPPQRSGMANAAGEIYKAANAAGASCDLVTAFGLSSIKNLHHWRFPGLGFLSLTPKIISLVREYDLIHLHYPCYGNALMVALALRLSSARGEKKPLVISYHMDTVGRGLRKPVFAFHGQFIAPHFLRRADKIVVASADYASHSLLAKYPALMAKVVEIPFGVDAARFHPASKDPLTVTAVKNILFTAALDEQHYFKGLSVLLEALAKIPAATLTVVGEGNLKERYMKQAEQLQLDGRVVFTGRVSDEELPKYFQAADIFCSASVDRSEAYGIAIIEASASGLPIVATDIPGVRSVVKNNETGLLVKPGDPAALAKALNSILNDAQLATRLGAAARQFALTRTWSDAGHKYLEIYKNLLVTTNN